MKPSLYNVYQKIDSKFYVFNTYTLKHLEISQEQYELLKNNDKNLDKIESCNELAKLGIVINNNVNELYQLKKRYKKEQKEKDVLTITIAPTLRCNFACPYCYENRDGKIIDEKEQDAIIDFIHRNLEYGYKKINVIWFGGEPLIAFNIISHMSNEIIEICDKYNVEYNAFLTTNGFLLTDEISKKLSKLKINQLYITLDGLADVHDKRRCLIGKGNTFDTIVRNIKNAKRYKINIVIRMNIDKTNIDNIEELRKFVATELKLPMYLGLVREYTESCNIGKENYLTKKEYARILNEFNEKQEKTSENIFPRQLPIYCRACKIGTFVIDPDLNLYKCENDIGRIENRIGSVENYQFENEINNAYNPRFYKWNPFKYKKCRSCNLLPICMGGCPFIGIREKTPECEIYKYNFNKIFEKIVQINGSTSK